MSLLIYKLSRFGKQIKLPNADKETDFFIIC
jgi:hypothetical protein